MMKKPVKRIAALSVALILSVSSVALASDYTVTRGDSLWKIAKKQLGAGSRWTEVYEANRETIASPNRIYAGQVIVIPNSEIEEAAAPVGKVAVNFGGVITEIQGRSVTLDSGKTVLVTEDTRFGGPGIEGEVSGEFAVGNYIQGFTADDSGAAQITAARICANLAPAFAPGRIMVNYEGRITAVDGNRVTLDNGKTLIITRDTVFSIPQGVVERVILTEGQYIQGYTPDNPEDSELTAARLHVTPL